MQGLLTEARLPLGKALQRLDFGAGVDCRVRHGHDRGGLGRCQRQGIGGGGFFRAGDEQDEAGGSNQLARLPAMGKTKGHAQVQVFQVR
ncbi:hypothetical protein D3C76_1164480 [compost metagenome]